MLDDDTLYLNFNFYYAKACLNMYNLHRGFCFLNNSTVHGVCFKNQLDFEAAR
jgi:hypothetical protein